MKLAEMFAMDDSDAEFDKISAVEKVSNDPGIEKMKKEKSRKIPSPSGKRKDAKRLADTMRFRADGQGSADGDLNSETPEPAPLNPSGMR